MSHSSPKVRRLLAVAAASVLLLGAVGCGSRSSTDTSTSPRAGGDGGGTTTTGSVGASEKGGNEAGGGGGKAQSAPSSKAKQALPEPEFTAPVHHDSGGGSAQFRAKGGDNSIQEYGSEPSGSEFEEAAAALHGYLDARAAGAWAAACEYMDQAIAAELAKLVSQAPGAKGKGGCPEAIAGLSAGVPSRALREAAVADVASLRAEGDSGFLLFHGARGVDYFMPMSHEDGVWKVRAPAASPLP